MKIKLLGKKLIPLIYTSNSYSIFELMIKGIEFENTTSETVKINKVIFKFSSNKRMILDKYYEGLSLKKIIKETASFCNGMLLSNKFGTTYLRTFFSTPFAKRNIQSNSARIKPREKVILGHQLISIKDDIFNKLEIVLEYKIGNKLHQINRNFRIAKYEQKNKYILPVKGVIRCLAGPATGVSHHRQTSTQEFAWDFLHYDNQCKLFKGKGKNNSDFYGFGKNIFTPASGKIIEIKDGLSENIPFQIPEWKDERTEKFGYLQTLFGNHVIIEHRGGEFSYLCHLKNNSIKVKKGQRVKQGEVIAKLGNNGASGGPHLHYHVMNGRDFFKSQSIPINFDNVCEYPWSECKFKDFNSNCITIAKSV